MRSKVTARMYSIYKVNGRGIEQGCQTHQRVNYLSLTQLTKYKRILSI